MFEQATTSSRIPGSDLIQLCRPHQWTKNVFVLMPLVFSGAFTQRDAVLHSLLALACFCLWSSSVYCLNDVLDAAADREHPRKCRRPIPAGRVSPAQALALALGMTSIAFVTASMLLPLKFLIFGLVYLINSTLYCITLKHRVIVDVLSISAGFVLRLLAGCEAVSVVPTSWIVVCGFSLALLLGFGKRRLEIANLEPGSAFRPVLQSYSAEKLNLLLGVTSSTCLLSYMLYTVAPTTIALHGTQNLVYTVPFVAYGVFRYLFKVQEGKHDGPDDVLLKDPVFAINGALWLLSVLAVLYLPRLLQS